MRALILRFPSMLRSYMAQIILVINDYIRHNNRLVDLKNKAQNNDPQ